MKNRNRVFSILILILITSWLIGCFNNSTVESEYTVMQGATIIDATANAPIENGVIVLKGNQIIQVGQLGKVDLPEEANFINLEGKWIIPGFIDLHVHFWESGKTWAQPTFVIDLREFVPYEEEVAFMKRRISYTLQKYLCAGVTSVVPLGAISWEYEVRELAKRQEQAPNVYLAGGFISNYPPVGEAPVFDGKQTGFWIENADDAQGLVDYLDSTKVDLIKAGFISGKGYPMETFEPKLSEIIKESHERNLKVSVHATELENAKIALRSGADILAHTVNDTIIDEEFIKLAQQNSAVITSSLGVITSFNDILTSSYTLSDMDECCGDPEVIQSWVEWSEIPEIEKPQIPNWILAADESLEIMLENTRIAYHAGLPICVGSDGGNIGSLHGPSYHRELEFLAKAGLSAMDILIAATKNGALALGMESKLGTIEIGKQADLLVLKSNPLESVNNLKHIEFVIVRGNLIKREELTNH